MVTCILANTLIVSQRYFAQNKISRTFQFLCIFERTFQYQFSVYNQLVGIIDSQSLIIRNRQGAALRDGDLRVAGDGDILFQGIVAAHGAGLVALAVDQPAAVAGGGQRFFIGRRSQYHTVGQQGGVVPDGHVPCAVITLEANAARRVRRRSAPGGEGTAAG